MRQLLPQFPKHKVEEEEEEKEKEGERKGQTPILCTKKKKKS